MVDSTVRRASRTIDAPAGQCPPGIPLRRRLPPRASSALPALLLTLLACEGPTPDDGTLVGRIRASAPSQRTSVALRSAPQRGPCLEQPAPSTGTVRVARCAARDSLRPDADALAAMDSAARAMRARFGLDAVHAVALSELLWRGGTRNSLDRSISLLSDLAASSLDARAARVDLSAAYHDRAELTQSPRDLMAALDESVRAQRERATGPIASSTFPARSAGPDHHLAHAARHNEALALDRLELLAGTVATVDALMSADGSVVDPAIEGELAARRAHADSAIAMAFADTGTAARDAQAMREHGWHTLLPAWAQAHTGGDAATARDMLDSASRLGARLIAAGGDPSLASAADSIRRHLASPATSTLLAEAHVALDSARKLVRRRQFEQATTLLARFRRERLPSTALRQAMHYQHAVAISPRDQQAAERELMRLRADFSGTAASSIRGRAAAALGTFALRGARHDEGMAFLAEAGEVFSTVGEIDAIGNVQSVMAEAFFEIDRRDEGYAMAHRALVTLRERPNSVWRHNVLMTLTRASIVDGRPFAALRIADEDIALTERLPVRDPLRVMYQVEARMARARVLRVLGDRDGARETLADARALLPTLTPDAIRFLGGDLLLAEATVANPGVDELSITSLDSVVGDTVRRRNTPRLQVALLARAEWRLRTADTAGAIADFDSASALFEVKQQGAGTLVDRAALLGAASGTATRLALLALSRGDHAAALEALERPRRGLFDDSSRRDGRTGRDERTVVVALLGDSLYAWTRDGAEPRLVVTPASAGEVRRAVAFAKAGLAERASADAVRPALEALHEWLVTPIASRLPRDGAAVRWVAHGELADVPFAALRDRQRGSYLVERFVVSHGWLSDAMPGDAAAGPGRVVVVADPSFESRAYPDLAPLAEARGEARTIALQYGVADTIAGPAATRPAVLRGLQQSRVFHFAGHALVDERRVEQSRLVLAGDVAASLTAGEIARLDLTRMRLAVLSACTGVSAQRASGTALADLAGSFLAAGATGVVASPWLVDDGLARTLMEALHDAYRKSGDGAAALRAAQLRMIRSAAEREQAPGAWAAFRYITR